MTYWKAVKLITGHLWRREWLGMSGTIAITLYMGGFLSLSVDDLFSEEGTAPVFYGLMDWIFLLLMPCLGIVMNRTIFTMWREDTYSKRLAVFRAYPIPASAIVGARFAQFLALASINTAIVMTMAFTLSPDLRNAVSGARWFEFAVLWACYSVIVNAVLALLELGASGKRYVQLWIAWYAFVTVAVVAMTLAGVHPFMEALRWTGSDASSAIVAVAVVCAALAVRIGYRATVRRVASRSISF